MNFIKEFVKGMAIGSGAILPGISSGVLCVILGIYDKLITSVLDIFSNFKKNFFYLLPIILGGLCGAFILGKLLKLLFETFPIPIKYSFIGLILGSTPSLIKKINKEKTFKTQYLIFTFFAFLIGIILVLIETTTFSNFTNNNLIFKSSPLLLVFAGFFMSIGIVVPGVSSTLILMCFGIYDTYLNSIAAINLSVLVPIGFGILLGCIVFLKLIQYLMNHYYMQTFYSIIGFTLGSIFILYTPISFNFTGFISILLFIICFYLSSLLEKI